VTRLGSSAPGSRRAEVATGKWQAGGDEGGDHDVQPLTTARLTLRMPAPTDWPALFELYSDPDVWRPDPLTRHDNPEQTDRMIGHWLTSWRGAGLGMWTAWHEGVFAGIGGCFLRYGIAWNLGFRLRPAYWGQGYAQEISQAAFGVARSLRSDLPVTAYCLEVNERSRRAVERTGLTRVWRGPDAGNPDPAAIRLLYSDQPLRPHTLRLLTER
jgi:RimJ/RimL family protein N-acetyltransferase